MGPIVFFRHNTTDTLTAGSVLYVSRFYVFPLSIRVRLSATSYTLIIDGPHESVKGITFR